MLGETANIKEYHPFLSSNFYLWKNMDISSHHTLETPKEEKIPRKRFLVSRWQSDCCSNTSPTWKKNEERKHEIHSQGPKGCPDSRHPDPSSFWKGATGMGNKTISLYLYKGFQRLSMVFGYGLPCGSTEREVFMLLRHRRDRCLEGSDVHTSYSLRNFKNTPFIWKF